MMKPRYRRSGLVAGMAALSSLAFAGTATAHHGSNDPTTACGQVVTADLVLTHNVGPCAAAAPSKGALTVRASGTSTDPVTLNLNGKKVFGCTDPLAPCNALTTDPSLPYVTGEGPGIVIDEENYVQITDSSTSPTVAGTGTVSDFDTGIVIRGSYNVIEKVDVLRNVGTALTSSDYGEGIGIYTGETGTGSTNNTVRENNVEGNGPYAGVALYNFNDETGAAAPTRCATTDNVVGGPAAGDGNKVEDNRVVVPNGTTHQDDGIRIEPDVCKTIVQYNEVSNSSLDGIAVFARATGTQVRNNIVTGNGNHPLTHRKGDGIVVFRTADGCTVDGNTVTGNAGNGIRVDATGCTISNNTPVTGNGTADPRATDPTSQYAYFDLKDGNGNCTANNWFGNDPSATRWPGCIE